MVQQSELPEDQQAPIYMLMSSFSCTRYGHTAIGQTEELGSFGVAAECMEACKARSGCKHFLFGWYALDRPSASP